MVFLYHIKRDTYRLLAGRSYYYTTIKCIYHQRVIFPRIKNKSKKNLILFHYGIYYYPMTIFSHATPSKPYSNLESVESFPDSFIRVMCNNTFDLTTKRNQYDQELRQLIEDGDSDEICLGPRP
jgi:hypothetical protein